MCTARGQQGCFPGREPLIRRLFPEIIVSIYLIIIIFSLLGRDFWEHLNTSPNLSDVVDEHLGRFFVCFCFVLKPGFLCITLCLMRHSILAWRWREGQLEASLPILHADMGSFWWREWFCSKETKILAEGGSLEGSRRGVVAEAQTMDPDRPGFKSRW